MVAVAGAVMLCVAAPASDQDEKAYVIPPRVWVAGALIECVEPMIAVTVYGVACVVPSNTTCRPLGAEAIVRLTGWGSIVTLVVPVAP